MYYLIGGNSSELLCVDQIEINKRYNIAYVIHLFRSPSSGIFVVCSNSRSGKDGRRLKITSYECYSRIFEKNSYVIA